MPAKLHLIRNFLVIGLFLNASCVGKKIYRSELKNRTAAEARESVLQKELADRKRECSDLVKQVGDLNRSVGNLQSENDRLELDVKNRSKEFGANSSKLQEDKNRLEAELAQKNEDLIKKEALLSKIRVAQAMRKQILDNLYNRLIEDYGNWIGVSVQVGIKDETILITLADDKLFDANGIAINSEYYGTLLGPVANILSQNPNYDLQVITFTDNTMPKEKSLRDSWDWSLVRANNVVRVLIKELYINANQLTPVGKGEYYPVSSNETAEGRLQNRRTILLLKPAIFAIPTVD